jgi:hypothetical protein
MKERKLVALAVVVGFCVVLTVPGLVRAEIVWSDDFNDGDFDGWNGSR